MSTIYYPSYFDSRISIIQRACRPLLGFGRRVRIAANGLKFGLANFGCMPLLQISEAMILANGWTQWHNGWSQWLVTVVDHNDHDDWSQWLSPWLITVAEHSGGSQMVDHNGWSQWSMIVVDTMVDIVTMQWRIWLGRFLAVCFLYKTNPNPRKTVCCGKKWPKCHF